MHNEEIMQILCHLVRKRGDKGKKSRHDPLAGEPEERKFTKVFTAYNSRLYSLIFLSSVGRLI